MFCKPRGVQTYPLPFASDNIERKLHRASFLIASGKISESTFSVENEWAMFEWSCRLTYIALGNMMTSAALIGVDACPMEGFDKEKVEQLLAKEGIMDPEHFGISCMAAFGYRVNEPRGKTRQMAEQVIQWV